MSILLEQVFNWTTLRPLLVSVTLFYLVYRVFHKFLSFYSFSQMINKIPGPELSWSPLGHLYMFKSTGKLDRAANFYNTVCELAKAHSPKYSLIRLWLAVRPVIIIYKADSAEKILSSNVHIQKGSKYNLITPWLGTGLLTRPFPYFQQSMVEDFLINKRVSHFERDNDNASLSSAPQCPLL